MSFVARFVTACVLTAAAFSPLQGASDLVFVLGEGDSPARVFDADSLRLLRSLPAGSGASHAFGVRTAEGDEWGSFWLVAGDRIIELDADFEPRRTVELPAPVGRDRAAAALTPNGALLLVALGDALAVVDTANGSLSLIPTPGLSITGVAARTDSISAFVIASGTRSVRRVDLSGLTLDPRVWETPIPLSSLVLGHDGGVLGTAPGQIYDLEALTTPGFVRRPETELASVETDSPEALPAEVRFVPTSTGLVGERLVGEGATSTLREALAGFDLETSGADGVVSTDGGRAWITAGDKRKIVAVERSGETAEAALSSPAGALALVENPGEKAQAGTLSREFGDGQAVAPGVPFALGVRANGGTVAGLKIFLAQAITGGPSVSCDPTTTDAAGLAQITCIAGFWPLTTQIQLIIGDELGRRTPIFGITVIPTVLVEGLTKLSGDRLTVPRNSTFALSVQAVQNSAAIPLLPLTIRVSPSSAPVSCPSDTITDDLGQATIICSTLEIPRTQTVLITFDDGLGRTATFSVTLLPETGVDDGIFKLSGDDQAVTQGTPLAFPLVAQMIREGRPAAGVKLTITVSDVKLVFCPKTVFTNSSGQAFISCSAGPIFGNGFAEVFVNDDLGVHLIEPFRVSVIGSTLSKAKSLVLRSKNKIRAKVGDTVPGGIVVEALDISNQPTFGAAVFFSSNLNVTFSPSVAISGARGLASVDLTFGCPGGTGVARVGTQPGLGAILVNLDVDVAGTRLAMLQGDGQAGRPGQRLEEQALVVQLGDDCLNPISGEQVFWSVDPPEAATLENVISTTDGDGRSSVLVRLGAQPRAFRVLARYRELSQEFNLAVTTTPARLAAASGAMQTIPRDGLSEPLVVEAISEEGFPVPGVDVFFAVLEGPGVLTETAVRTGADGRASTQVRAGSEFGTVRVLASSAPQTALRAAGKAQSGALTAEFTLLVSGRFPQVSAGGFVNAASFWRGWSPGSLGTIFGAGMMEGVQGVVFGAGPPFPTRLRGVQVTVNGVPAPILSMANVGGAEQINLQVPFGIPAPSTATVVIDNNGATSTFDVEMKRAQPGIFEIDAQGGRYAAALHADFRAVVPADPARPGETILLFLTGMGPLSPSVPTNVIGPVPAAETAFDPTVGIEHEGVVDFGGFYAPGFVGLYQVNFRVPNDVETGQRILNVVVDGVSSQEVRLPVRR